jgi:hypothetical protein
MNVHQIICIIQWLKPLSKFMYEYSLLYLTDRKITWNFRTRCRRCFDEIMPVKTWIFPNYLLIFFLKWMINCMQLKIYNFFLIDAPCILKSKTVHSPTNALFIKLGSFKLYTRIHINSTPTCFGLRPSSTYKNINVLT